MLIKLFPIKSELIHFKKTALIFLLGFFVTTSAAQTTIQIGSSISNSGVVPIRTDLDYSYTQQIYTATEMASAGVTGQALISKLRFYLTNASTTNSDDWTIYMGNTTRTVFSTTSDWEPITNLTTNYSGTVTPPTSGNWMEIVLDDPFIWNGVDNIIIAIDQNQSGSSASNSDWQISAKGENRAIYHFSGLTNADPTSPPTASGIFDKVNNIQFEVTPIYPFSQNAGNALNFNANNGYCSANLPTLFDNIGTNDFTIESWVKPEVLGASKRVFFAQKDTYNFCSILLSFTNVLYVFIGENGYFYSVNTQIPLSTTEWSHIAITWDASSSSIVSYINGVQVTGISGGASSIGTDETMTIGARSDGAQIFKGSIDEFRIWDDIRTKCEIFGSMNTEFTTTQPNLIVSYDFNQGIAGGLNTGVTTLPELNNNYNATLNGFTLNGSTSNWIASNAPIIITNNNSNVHYLNDVVSACVSYVWSNNTTYTSSNNSATQTYINSSGCTVIESLELTIKQPTMGIDVVSACDSYTWIDGNTYTTSNNSATWTLPNSIGCDSIVTLNLTINTVDVSVTSNSTVLTADNSSATYQWFNCITNTEISGENNASYTATSNGNYAVIVSENGCSDTSTCYSINTVGLNELNNTSLLIYPNPSSGKVYIEFDQINLTTELKIVDILGKEVMTYIPNSSKMELDLDVQPGSYFIYYGGAVYQLVIN